MYFKRLEMFGFKSFAEKTKVDFERGITAIVGPNGCGKSNIADGIKWVLGEQSVKAMRGSSMEDVIFNGTERKEPLGYAEVSLVLSNESKFLPIEYDEVTISRRLYRSGESEYLINKNPVRLKDVNELLMGSGLGVNAYSLIEQGKMDQILSANPEDRRAIFEEASGITRYKSKKREAVRKLEATEQNLLRVNDIVKEVERQINSIERQVKKARRYQEQFDRLKELDTTLASHNYNQMKEKRDSFSDESGGIKEEEQRLVSLLESLSQASNALKEQEDTLNNKISRYRNDLSQARIAIDRNNDRVNMDRERLEELYKYEIQQASEVDSLDKRMKDIAKNVEGITEQLTKVSEDLRSKDSELINKEENISSLKKRIEENSSSIKVNKTGLLDILAKQSKLRNEIAKITSDIQNISSRLRRLDIERENVAKELGTIDEKLSQVRLSVNMIISKVEILENERITAQNELKKEDEEGHLIEKRINDSKNHILALHSKSEFLKNLMKRHEGFTGGTQVLLNKLSNGELQIHGSLSPLADLLEPNSGYEAACEAALQGDLQTLVIDDWDTAFTALAFLVENNLGKASFMKNIPQGLAGSSSEGDEVLSNSMILGNAAGFMKFKPQYETLFKHLLKDTYIVNNIEEGISVLRSLHDEKQERIKLVTIKGDIITKDIITGGSHVSDFTSSIIGRQMRISEIEEEIAHSEKNALILKGEGLKSRERIASLRAETKRIEDALRSEEIVLTQERSAESNLENERRKIEDEVNLLTLELEETTARKSELIEAEANLRSQLEEGAREEEILQNSITTSQLSIEDGSKKREELLISITQIRTELTSLKSREDELYKAAESEKIYHDDQINILNEKRRSIEEAAQRKTAIKEEIARLQEDTERLTERHGTIENELTILNEEHQGLRTKIDAETQKLDEKREELNSIKDKVHSVEMDSTQLSFHMETLGNRIEQAYKIDLETHIADTGGIDNVQHLEKEIGSLRQSIEKMGNVNLVAIDEHSQLQERSSFLKHQSEDLSNAKETLLKAIRKINQTTRSLFMESFTSIQAEFRNYFRFLFGGGKADVILLDEKDVLESGIEIIARPPGKKLQTISLLSGGEKALTAIALLFAIFKIKPSPFCLLDEIDAPLDESNIGRFSKTLQEFARESQFIIITHNKKTISIADVMYGITMEQSGVSKIMSVKFAKKNDAEREKVLI